MGPETPNQVKAWLAAMIDMALADGKIDPKEQKLLETIGRHLDDAPMDIRRQIRERRAELYRLNRKRLHHAKNKA